MVQGRPRRDDRHRASREVRDPNVLLQVLDIESMPHGDTPDLIAEELLRLEALEAWGRETARGYEML